jgi:hypothetical protein
MIFSVGEILFQDSYEANQTAGSQTTFSVSLASLSHLSLKKMYALMSTLEAINP